MLFRTKIEAACAYCRHGAPAEEGTVVCAKKGVMRAWQKCRAFSYDPLRREPEAPLPPRTEGVDEADFTL